MKIETERLRIRNFKYNEASKVHQIDSNFEVMRHITEGITLPRSESEKRLLSFIDAYQTNSNMGIWLVELKEKREFIGRASLLKNDKDGY